MTTASWGQVTRAIGRLLVLATFAAGWCSLPAVAAERFFSAPSRSDFIYSPTRDILYIANSSQILRYRVSTGEALAPINDPNGSGGLRGIDLSIDERTLAVTDVSFNFRPRVLLIDLDSDAVSQFYFQPEVNEYATYGVAWGNDGRVLVSGASFGYFDAPLHLLDPGSGSTTVVGRVESTSTLRANSDRSVIAVESGLTPVSIASIARYLVGFQALIYPQFPGYGESSIDAAANRDASQYAQVTTGATTFFDSTLQQLPNSLGTQNGGRPLSAAYDPGKDVIYAPWSSTRQIRAFDTATFTEVGRFLFDRRFTSFAFDESVARTSVSGDGQWLFASIDSGVIGIRTSEIQPALTPDQADLPTAEDAAFTVREDDSLFVSLPGNDPINSGIQDYELARLPSNGTVEFVGSNFAIYRPNADFFGTDSFTYTLSNEAGTSREATITMTVTPVNDAPTYLLNRQLYRTQLGGLRRSDRDAVLDIRPGPANESGQQLGFAVSNNNPALFIEQPRISPDGVLTYRPRLFGSGEATVTVTGIDSGGSADGGVDRGPTMSFRIAIR